MTPLRPARRSLLAALCAVALLAGCATPTAVSTDTKLEDTEGLVALRVVDVGDVPIRRFTVVSEATGQAYPLRAVRFGQSRTMTYMGRLPAGRYRPGELLGSRHLGLSVETIRVPLRELTGQFDVEARRVTDLGSMVFIKLDGRIEDEKVVGGTRTWRSSFALPLVPTPTPAMELVAARYPQLAGLVASKSTLGWVPGTVPEQPAQVLDFARTRVRAATPPTLVDERGFASGGSLGVVVLQGAAGPRLSRADTVHAVEAFKVLSDGRWLIGGEEGFVAVSGDRGREWKPLAGLTSEDLVLHITQAPDGRLLLVADRDREVVVYESAADPIAWKPVKRLPSEREQGWFTQDLFEGAQFLRDAAGSTADRLYVFARPSRLHTLDLRSGVWESHETPRNFNAGMKVSPDGFVLGMWSQHWVYGSQDHGKTWYRLESWVNMSEPHFLSAQRGIMVAADMSFTGPVQYKVRHSSDGGKSWKVAGDAPGFWWPLQALWTDASGERWYTRTPGGLVKSSSDQGKTWR